MRRLLAKIRKLLKDRRTRQMFTRIVSITAAIVVFITTYALVLPAITMEIEAECGIEAHQHDDSCFEYGLICGLEESDQHQHGDGCYGRTGNLICGKEVHVHSEACYHRDEAENMMGEVSETDSAGPVMSMLSGTGGVSAQSADIFVEEGVSPEDGGLPDDAGEVLNEDGSQYDAAADLQAEDQGETADAYAGDEGALEDYGTFDENGDGVIDSAEVFSDGTAENVGGELGADGNIEGNIEDGSNTENATGTAEGGETAVIETGDPAESAELSGTDGQDSQMNAEESVPAMDPVLFGEVLNDRTGIYYYHTPDGETVENSAYITDWKKISKDTELGENDLLRVYLAYTIPAGSLNATNQTARYRLPGNLHLSDGQVNAINQMENGIAAQYADYANLQILDPENYHKYLGAEAVEGTRTPDQSVDDYLQSLRNNQAGVGTDTNGPEAGSADGSAVQEFISATVQVENIYNTDSSSGEKGALLGQDLIFTFSPYTIEENRHAYDSTGQQMKTGRDIRGWLTLDFNMEQVNWIEQERTTRTADIVFAAERTDSQGYQTDKIHTILTLVTDNMEALTEDAEGGSTEETDDQDGDSTGDSEADAVDNETEDNTEDQDVDEPVQNPDQKDDESTDEKGDKEDDRKYPAQSFEDTITVRMGTLSTDAANDSALVADAVDNIQKKTELTVSVIAEEGTFPEGTTMILTPVTGGDLDTVAEAVEGTVEGKTAGFHAVDISFRDADGKEIEPRKPIKVSMQSESIRQAVENPNTDTVIVHLEDSENKNNGGDDHENANKDGMEGTNNDSEENNDNDNMDGNADGAEQTEEVDGNTGKDADLDAENVGNSEADSTDDSSDSMMDSNEQNEATSASGNGLDDSTVTVTTVPGSAEEDNLTFESDSFSVYAIVYTVDFHYEVNGKMYEFSIPGGGFASFYKIVEVLGISELGTQSGSGDENEAENSEIEVGNGENTDGNAVYNVVEETGVEDTGTYSDAISLNNVEVSEATKKFVADVVSVEFSNPELVWVGKAEAETTVGGLKETNGLKVQYSAELTEEQIAEINSSTVEVGDWALISILPFTSEETLTVTMKNGDRFVVKVTDGQVITEYNSIVTGRDYILYVVRGSNEYYALGNDGRSHYVGSSIDALEGLDSSYSWNYDFDDISCWWYSESTYLNLANSDNRNVIGSQKDYVFMSALGSGFDIYRYSDGSKHLSWDTSGFKVTSHQDVPIRVYMKDRSYYEFTVAVNNDNYGSVSCSETITNGNKTNKTAIVATPADDCYFVGWRLGDQMSGGELRAEVLANYLRHERLPDCTFLPENALYQRTYGTLPEGGVIIQQSHKRSQAARSFAA